ncbi:TadE family type IV pilus minor pilin [Microbacterium album]|uniref:TadE-like protein n=1 Tax=Microbacterium album TaxID=2053191 RepID=A0A917MMA2_9MICO|nr:TadE family type IV pilus minor pilin [Microbacterium album]GGH43360.1 hypothetical protein GCM10010921_17200 [Microbacterium album]
MIGRAVPRRGPRGRDGGGPFARVPGGERGSVAAELAVALPAVAVVLALGIGGLFAAATHVRLQDAAADAARLIARGESEARATGAVVGAVAGARVAAVHQEDLVCVTATAEVAVAGLPVPLRAASCALAGGL